jgi:hypothetical protein
MIYGKPLVNLQTDVTDRIGVRTLVLFQNWQPSSSTLTQAQIDAEMPDVPSVSGGLLLVGQQTILNGGFRKTLWTFEGVNGNGKTVTFKDRAHSLDFGFKAGFSQMEIQKHPSFEALKTQYGGQYDPETGRVIWPELMPNANTTTVGLAGSSNAQQVNPMFDFQDYFSMEGEYTHRYASMTLPGTLYNYVGYIFSTGQLPGIPPVYLPDSRNWLYVPPTYRARGLVFDITETYWLSGRGGWPQPIYGRQSLTAGGSGGNPAGGNGLGQGIQPTQ